MNRTTSAVDMDDEYTAQYDQPCTQSAELPSATRDSLDIGDRAQSQDYNLAEPAVPVKIQPQVA